MLKNRKEAFALHCNLSADQIDDLRFEPEVTSKPVWFYEGSYYTVTGKGEQTALLEGCIMGWQEVPDDRLNRFGFKIWRIGYDDRTVQDKIAIKEAEAFLTSRGYYRTPGSVVYHKDGQAVKIVDPWLPKSPVKLYDGSQFFVPEPWGFRVVITHGGVLCPSDSFICFPKLIDETTFAGCLQRMEDFFSDNYDYLDALNWLYKNNTPADATLH